MARSTPPSLLLIFLLGHAIEVDQKPLPRFSGRPTHIFLHCLPSPRAPQRALGLLGLRQVRLHDKNGKDYRLTEWKTPTFLPKTCAFLGDVNGKKKEAPEEIWGKIPSAWSFSGSPRAG